MKLSSTIFSAFIIAVGSISVNPISANANSAWQYVTSRQVDGEQVHMYAKNSGKDGDWIYVDTITTKTTINDPYDQYGYLINCKKGTVGINRMSQQVAKPGSAPHVIGTAFCNGKKIILN